MNVASVEKLRPIPPELYAALIHTLGHAQHGSGWDLATGWGADVKALHTAKYQRWAAAILPLFGYEPRPLGAA